MAVCIQEAKLRTLWAGLLLAAALFAGLPPQSARADADTHYDAEAIPHCVQAAAPGALEACKGAGALPCVAGDDTTIGLVLCWRSRDVGRTIGRGHCPSGRPRA